MADIPTRLDYFAIARDYILQNASKIDPSQVDIVGSDINLFAGISALLADHITRQLVYRTNALILDTAEGEDLDRLILDSRSTISRKAASSAVGTVTFSRPSNTAGAGSIPFGTVLKTPSGIEYITTQTASFSATSVSVTSRVRAAQAGKETQVAANQINQFVDATLLFDGSIEVTNTQATSGGEDAEEDELLRERARSVLETAQRGTLAAIEQGALATEGVVSAEAQEILEDEGTPARLVYLYIADSSGVANDALVDQVKTTLLEYRAAGIQVIIFNSLPQIVSVQLSLSFRADVDTTTLTETVRQAVTNYINSLRVNESLYLSNIFSILARYIDDGLIVNQGSVVSPVGDISPTLGQTIRTTLANVTTV